MAESKKDTDKKIAAILDEATAKAKPGKPIEFVSNPVVQKLPDDYKKAAPPQKAAAKPAAKKASPNAMGYGTGKGSKSSMPKPKNNGVGFGTGKGSKSSTPKPKNNGVGFGTGKGSKSPTPAPSRAANYMAAKAREDAKPTPVPSRAANYMAAKAREDAKKEQEAPHSQGKPIVVNGKKPVKRPKTSKSPLGKLLARYGEAKKTVAAREINGGKGFAKGGRVGDGCAKSGRTRGRFV